MFFTIWVTFLSISRIYIFFHNIENIESHCYFFFSSFIQPSFSNEKFIPCQLYLLTKGLIVAIHSECYPIFHDKLTTFHCNVSKTFRYSLRKDTKSFLTTSSALSVIMISLLSLFECIMHSSSLSLEQIKLVAVANWIFHVPDFLRLFMISFKYELIVFLYQWYFHIQYICNSRNCLLFLVYNDIFFIMIKKIFNISHYSLITLTYIFSLERFFISLIILCFFLLQTLNVSSLYFTEKSDYYYYFFKKK